jgi:hypothetical protein
MDREMIEIASPRAIEPACDFDHLSIHAARSATTSGV